jgi:hypothetical protein
MARSGHGPARRILLKLNRHSHSSAADIARRRGRRPRQGSRGGSRSPRPIASPKTCDERLDLRGAWGRVCPAFAPRVSERGNLTNQDPIAVSRQPSAVSRQPSATGDLTWTRFLACRRAAGSVPNGFVGPRSSSSRLRLAQTKDCRAGPRSGIDVAPGSDHLAARRDPGASGPRRDRGQEPAEETRHDPIHIGGPRVRRPRSRVSAPGRSVWLAPSQFSDRSGSRPSWRRPWVRP